ncbi:MAG: hypothetical protein AB1775_11975 [Bacteroidota bacterium]
MTKTQHRIYLSFLLLIGAFVLIAVGIYGYRYYLTPYEDRFFNPLDKLLKPSGFLGHGFGIIGSIMMILGVAMYMVRKRSRKMLRMGLLKHWLEMHIFLCSVGPILVLYHTAFKFGGIVAVSFWSMVAVVVSGVVGRFIYIQIPRSIHGQEYSLDELKLLNFGYTETLRKDYNLQDDLLKRLDHFRSVESYETLGFFSVMGIIIQDYFENASLIHQIRKELVKRNISHKSIDEIIKICKSKLVLTRRIILLHSVQRLFKYWHIIHLPFALVMLIIMLIHVGVAVAFGYTWIF